MTTFTRTSAGTYSGTTGLFTAPVVTTIAGSAIQVRGQADRYEALGLTLSTSPTLLFTPTDYNLYAGSTEFVQPGDTVSWAGATHTVRDVEPIAPDGIVIAARIIVSV